MSSLIQVHPDPAVDTHSLTGRLVTGDDEGTVRSWAKGDHAGDWTCTLEVHGAGQQYGGRRKKVEGRGVRGGDDPFLSMFPFLKVRGA